MPKLKPSIRPGETYTEPNFLRVHTVARAEPSTERPRPSSTPLYQPKGRRPKPGWNCDDRRRRGDVQEDAMFIARNYAIEHNVPVIYECHSE
jgi:hypothetical protein